MAHVARAAAGRPACGARLGRRPRRVVRAAAAPADPSPAAWLAKGGNGDAGAVLARELALALGKEDPGEAAAAPLAGVVVQRDEAPALADTPPLDAQSSAGAAAAAAAADGPPAWLVGAKLGGIFLFADLVTALLMGKSVLGVFKAVSGEDQPDGEQQKDWKEVVADRLLGAEEAEAEAEAEEDAVSSSSGAPPSA